MGKKKNKQTAHPLDIAPRIAPEMTRRERVLGALGMARRNGELRYGRELRVATPKGWVDGWALCHPGIGGSEGLRRLRELRADGYTIEMRRHPSPDRQGTRQYRLVPDPSRPPTLFD